MKSRAERTLAEQRHSRKNLHLVARNVVNATQLLVLLEIIPGRISRGIDLGTQQRVRARIGEKEHFAAIESEYFRQARYNLIGRMAFA